MVSKFVCAILALISATSAHAQPLSPSKPEGDPFAGMSAGGYARAQALNQEIAIAWEKGAEQVRVARTVFENLKRAQPVDMVALRAAARQFEDARASLGDFTEEWVALAAALDPSDRAIIIRRLPKIGGVIGPALPPPLPPRAPGR